MAARLSLPRSQQRHSNVAVVRLSKGKHSLEIACYKNKVVAYRNGAETNIEEVIQIDRVFSNVSRGEYASLSEMENLFGEKVSERQALELILKHGDVQVAERERKVSHEELIKDISTIIAQRIVHPVTKRLYPAPFIEETLRSMGVNLKTDQTAKRQALTLIKDLIARQIIPVMRALMRIKISGSKIDSVLSTFEHHTVSDITPTEKIIDLDPELFREFSTACTTHHLVLTVLEYAVAETSQGDAQDIQNFLDPIGVSGSNGGEGEAKSVTAAPLSKTAAKKLKRASRSAKKNAPQQQARSPSASSSGSCR